MDHKSIANFVVALREENTVIAFALEFLVLTATRSNEVTGARWSEINLDSGLWSLPPERMKAGRAHVVPLSARALEILCEAKKLGGDGFVFPSLRKDCSVSGEALRRLAHQLGGETVHGFRSIFRDWAGDCTDFPREVAEAALAHAVGDRTERAYRRNSALEKRRELMNAWVRY